MDNLYKPYNEIEKKCDILIEETKTGNQSYDKEKIQALVDQFNQELLDKYGNLLFFTFLWFIYNSLKS